MKMRLLAALLALTSAHAARAQTAEVEVKIDNFVFQPDAITVPVGTKLVWTNEDDIPHLVVDVPQTNGDAAFRSPALDTGDSFAFTFTKPGTYVYFCALHPHMVGKIIVK